MSGELRRLTYAEATVLDVTNAVSGWLDPTMPMRQYTAVVHKELEFFRAGGQVAPYDTLIRLLGTFPLTPNATLLDVGASSGYYSQVLKARHVVYPYTALDASVSYAAFAKTMFGDDIVDFIVADARNMSMISDRSYDIVVSGGALMHILDYPRAIREIQRVASRQIVFHRTPITMDGGPTEYYMKTAYGLPCLELHFNEDELLDLFNRDGWVFRAVDEIDYGAGHMSYLYERPLPHVQV